MNEKLFKLVRQPKTLAGARIVASGIEAWSFSARLSSSSMAKVDPGGQPSSSLTCRIAIPSPAHGSRMENGLFLGGRRNVAAWETASSGAGKNPPFIWAASRMG